MKVEMYCKKGLLSLSLFLVVVAVNGQTAELGGQQGQGTLSVIPRGMMTEIKSAERATMGSTYLNDDWVEGKIEFNNGEVLNDKPMRYDILASRIEVRIDGTVKGVNAKNFKTVTFNNVKENTKDVFVNAAHYQENGTPNTGIFKVVTSGKWSFFEKVEIVYIKPNYNQALDMGTKEGSYVKKSKFYLSQGTSVFAVPKSKKAFLEVINENTEALSVFMKEKKLSLKETEDVKLIVDFLNSK